MVYVWIAIALLFILIAVFKFLKLDKNQNAESVSSEEENRIPGFRRNENILSETESMLEMFGFIKDLHVKFGPIASFWRKDKFCVSVASPELFKASRNFACNWDLSMTDPFRQLIGEDGLTYADYDEATRRRKLYDQFFMLRAVKHFFKPFQEVAEETVAQWSKFGPEDHIDLIKYCMRSSMKSFLRTCFGEYFNNEANFDSFKEKFDYLNSFAYQKQEKDSSNEIAFQKTKKELRAIIWDIGESRKKNSDERSEDEEIFMDLLVREEHFTPEQRISDAIGFAMGAYYDFGTVMAYALYELSKNEEIQNTLLAEIHSVLGADGRVNYDNYNKLTYLRKVVDETIRLDYHAGALSKIIGSDVELAGYDIPKGTNLYHAHDVVLMDPNLWKDPETFDPERFGSEQSKGRSPFAFKPFGVSGVHHCPGYVFAYCQAAVLLSELVRAFRFQLVPGQTVPHFSASEIWVTIQKRNT